MLAINMKRSSNTEGVNIFLVFILFTSLGIVVFPLIFSTKIFPKKRKPTLQAGFATSSSGARRFLNADKRPYQVPRFNASKLIDCYKGFTFLLFTLAI